MDRQTDGERERLKSAGGGREDGGISPESLLNEWKQFESTRKKRTKETSEGQSEKSCLR